jgi:O-antigen/teichoic acid export membrane protein
MNYRAVFIDKAVALGKKKGFFIYLQNTFWLMFEKVFTLSVAFVVGIYVARYFGPENLGLLDYGRSIAIFLTTFATLSVEQFLVKKLIEDKARINLILGTFFFSRVFASLLSIAAVFVLFFLGAFDQAIIFTIVLIITCSSVFTSFGVLQGYFQSNLNSGKVALATSLQIICSAFLKVYFIIYEFSLEYFAAVYLIEGIVFAVGLIYSYQRNSHSILKWKFDFGLAKEILLECWPMMISGLIIIVYMRIDQLMIKWLLDAQSVGYYSSAVKLSEIWFFIGLVICNSFFPALVKARVSDPALYKRRLQSLLNLLVVIGLVITIPISIFSSTIIEMLYGIKFAPASGVLTIHAWSLVFIFVGQVGSRWLINENLQKMNLIRTFWGMMVNIILNLILIPKYGINGAAFATLFSQFTASYLSNSFSKKSKELFLAQTRALFPIHLATGFFSLTDNKKYGR